MTPLSSYELSLHAHIDGAISPFCHYKNKNASPTFMHSPVQKSISRALSLHFLATIKQNNLPFVPFRS